jgi:photosystem II stability/assembly factor-like uncharacterized protein
MSKRYGSVIIFTLIFINSIQAQPWRESLGDSPSFSELQAAFNNYWKDKKPEKGKGYKPFRRWEDKWRNRLNEDGSFPDPRAIFDEVKAETERLARQTNKTSAGAWTPFTPAGVPAGGGAGRLNNVSFRPGKPNEIWVAAPAGGIWRSNDNGNSWTSNTDTLPQIGFTDIAFDAVDSNVIYVATGDYDAGDVYSFGVLKSTNDGATWVPTGTMSRRNDFIISRVLAHPTVGGYVLASTNDGLFRTTNGGNSWARESSGDFSDIEFMPGNPNIVYGGVKSSGVFRSDDGGDSWSKLTDGLPTVNVGRVALAVSEANPDVVYALISHAGNSGLLGVWKSEDRGDNWRRVAGSTPNMLDWSTDGSGTGGQGWYDLCIAASPLDANVVYVGGVNVWKSTNGGIKWNCVGNWSGRVGNIDYIHADHHGLTFRPGSDIIYSANDGGIFRSTNQGSNWVDLSAGLPIMMLYRFAQSDKAPNQFLGGAQDNGTNFMTTPGSWSEVLGGDGMDCAIDFNNPNVMYGSSQNGYFNYTTDNWRNIRGLISTNGGGFSTNEPGAWTTPFVIAPYSNKILFAGYVSLFKSNDGGLSWKKLGTPSPGVTLEYIAPAPSDTAIIYATTGRRLVRSSNGGNTFQSIMTGLPVNASFSWIEVHPTNPQRLWITLSNRTANQKVYESVNGGATWINRSAGLPNQPVNCIIYQRNSGGILYCGTDIGVYVYDSVGGSWSPYKEGLPNTIVKELEINYATSQLRAGTYGRGAWQSPLKVAGVLPSCRYLTVFNEFSGSFEDGSGPANDYTSNNDCRWLINPPKGKNTVLTFTSLALRPGDTVIVYDGGTINAAVLGKFSGNTLPAALRSSTKTMLIRFLSDSSITDAGFAADWKVEGIEFCDSLVLYDRPVGTFNDGSGGLDYFNNTNCQWLIEPGSGSDVVVEFNGFNTEDGYDVVRLYDGTTNTDPLITELSGYIASGPIVASRGGKMLVEFISNSVNTAPGWAATYNTIPQAFCDGIQNLTGDGGTFDDGSLDSYYQNRTDCGWLITVSDNKKVRLQFNEFITPDTMDVVEVFDGKDTTAPLLARYHGGNWQSNWIAGTTANMLVRFRTDYQLTAPGWVARYEAVFSTDADKNTAGLHLQLYPNPTDNVIEIVADGISENRISWQLINSLGQVQLAGSELISENTFRKSIDLDKVSAGAYVFLLRTGNKTAYRNIIKY